MIRVERLTAESSGRLLSRRSLLEGPALEAARAILREFRADPDGTLLRLARQFDGAELDRLEVAPAEMDGAEKSVPQDVRSAILSMRDSVARYHRVEIPKEFEIEPIPGVVLGRRVVPFERAGLYVPGGLAPYPSSVVMGAVPAAVAGVKEIVLCTPPTSRGTVPAAVLFAARVCGVSRVFKTGGAQAVFAMAYGTPTIPRCDVVVGPGNLYVTAAKSLVRDDVAIDFLAGPSEILVVSDGEAPARFIAADLLGQAEHGPDALCVLVTTSRAQAEEVVRELEGQWAACGRAAVIREALTRQGAVLVADSLDEAAAFADAFAAEHLVIATRRPLEVFRKIRNAGSVFLGDCTPVAAGDYGAGPNHILPTLGEARRRGGVGVETFLKRISYQRLSREGLGRIAPMAAALARAEGLDAHGRSIEVRLGGP